MSSHQPPAHRPLQSVPVLRDVDVLVLGASTAAVAAALEVRASGKSAMVVGDLSYLGDDTAGTLQLWPEGWSLEDPLLAAAFSKIVPRPARPGAVKRVLEQALLAGSVPSLYLSRPVALLRDDEGKLAGAVLASRTSLLAVTCRALVDATRHGLVARLAEVPLSPRIDTDAAIEWTVIAKEAPRGWPGAIQEITPPFQHATENGLVDHRAFRLQIAREELGDDPMAVEHVAHSLLVDENVLITADLLVDPPREMLASPVDLVDRVADLDEASLQPSPGIWMLNDLLPLTNRGLVDWRRPDVSVALGRRIGACAASAVREASKAEPALHALNPHAGGDQSGDFRFADALLRGSIASIKLTSWAMPQLGAYNVVVAGGGTGGAPAGISAARAGATTLVLEVQHALGGVGTLGLISSYWFGNKVGFTAELNDVVMQSDSRSRSKNGNIWSPEVKIGVYHRMLQEAGGRAWLGSFAFGVHMEGEKVTGLLVSTPFGCGVVNAGCTVDATGNADVAAAAGAPCRLIDARHVAVQGTGLSPRLDPSVRHQNTDHTFVDETDPAGITAAHLHARAKYPDGFDNSSLVNSRERRQILGEYEVSPLDLLAERTFPDTFYTAISNFDTHGFIIHPVFMVTSSHRKALQAHVPFRCMLPRGIDGVLVTGLGTSAHRDALPVIRMQADVQNQGFAAGLAAAESATKDLPLRALDIRALQSRLVSVGVLAEGVDLHQDSFPLSAEKVKAAAEGDLEEPENVAVLFAHPELAKAPLLDRMSHDPEAGRRESAALVLGLMGNAEAVPTLVKFVGESDWDEGWDYRGMGQFGPSNSPLDASLIALARAGDERVVPTIEAKALALDENASFSHCRAVSLAAAILPHPRLAAALRTLLDKPGMRGHAILSAANAVDTANDDTIETESRNLSLRELYLARGLFLSGDPDGLGRTLLEQYASDLRGHFARHARALLDHPDPQSLGKDLA